MCVTGVSDVENVPHRLLYNTNITFILHFYISIFLKFVYFYDCLPVSSCTHFYFYFMNSPKNKKKRREDKSV